MDLIAIKKHLLNIFWPSRVEEQGHIGLDLFSLHVQLQSWTKASDSNIARLSKTLQKA